VKPTIGKTTLKLINQIERTFITPRHFAGGSGIWKRSEPTGGAAYGIPLNTANSLASMVYGLINKGGKGIKRDQIFATD
jgi:hypothetical protein